MVHKLNTSQYIKELRTKLSLGQLEFANLIGLGKDGERTIRGWETGEHKPSPTKWGLIVELEKKNGKLLSECPPEAGTY